MEKLSCETIVKIFSHINDRHDVSSFRCVQRSFSRIGLPFLFNHISIQPTSISLHNLLNISHRGHLAPYVKAVTMHVDHIAETVLNSYRHAEKGMPPRPSGMGEVQELQYRLTILNFCANSFLEFQISGDMVGLLAAAFAYLPNLKDLIFEDGPERLNPLYTPLRTNGIPQYLSILDQIPGFTGSLPDMSFWSEQYSFRCFKALIDAAYFNVKRFSSFKAKVLIDSAAFRGEVFDPQFMPRLAKVLRECRDIELTFYTGRGGREAVPDDLRDNLFTVLSPVKNLEKLSLSFGVNMVWASTCAPFDTIFRSNHVWPHLQELTIAGFGMRDDCFLALLHRHKDTLCKLTIKNCELSTNSWCAIVKAIKTTLRLVSFELGLDLFDNSGKFYTDTDVREMEDYVLGTGE